MAASQRRPFRGPGRANLVVTVFFCARPEGIDSWCLGSLPQRWRSADAHSWGGRSSGADLPARFHSAVSPSPGSPVFGWAPVWISSQQWISQECFHLGTGGVVRTCTVVITIPVERDMVPCQLKLPLSGVRTPIKLSTTNGASPSRCLFFPSRDDVSLGQFSTRLVVPQMHWAHFWILTPLSFWRRPASDDREGGIRELALASGRTRAGACPSPNSLCCTSSGFFERYLL